MLDEMVARQSPVAGAGPSDRLPIHRSGSPTGYSSAGCSPAEPASASPVTENSNSIPIRRSNQMRCSTFTAGMQSRSCSSCPSPIGASFLLCATGDISTLRRQVTLPRGLEQPIPHIVGEFHKLTEQAHDAMSGRAGSSASARLQTRLPWYSSKSATRHSSSSPSSRSRRALVPFRMFRGNIGTPFLMQMVVIEPRQFAGVGQFAQ